MNAGNKPGNTQGQEQESVSVPGPPAGWVALAGAGPGDEGLLTVRAAELLGQASLVIAPAALTPVARRYLSPEATLAEPADAAATARALVQAAREGQLAVRLYRGDPLLSGGAAAEAAACAQAGVRFEIVPGVPLATAVPAYAGIPLANDPAAELRVIHAAEISRVASAARITRSSPFGSLASGMRA